MKHVKSMLKPVKIIVFAVSICLSQGQNPSEQTEDPCRFISDGIIEELGGFFPSRPDIGMRLLKRQQCHSIDDCKKECLEFVDANGFRCNYINYIEPTSYFNYYEIFYNIDYVRNPVEQLSFVKSGTYKTSKSYKCTLPPYKTSTTTSSTTTTTGTTTTTSTTTTSTTTTSTTTTSTTTTSRITTTTSKATSERKDSTVNTGWSAPTQDISCFCNEFCFAEPKPTPVSSPRIIKNASCSVAVQSAEALFKSATQAQAPVCKDSHHPDATCTFKHSPENITVLAHECQAGKTVRIIYEDGKSCMFFTRRSTDSKNRESVLLEANLNVTCDNGDLSGMAFVKGVEAKQRLLIKRITDVRCNPGSLQENEVDWEWELSCPDYMI